MEKYKSNSEIKKVKSKNMHGKKKDKCFLILENVTKKKRNTIIFSKFPTIPKSFFFFRNFRTQYIFECQIKVYKKKSFFRCD